MSAINKNNLVQNEASGSGEHHHHSTSNSSGTQQQWHHHTDDLKKDRTIQYAKVFEGKRIFTIAYRLYPEKDKWNIEYAASVFRKDNEKESFHRKQHVQTARGRLGVRPLYTTFKFSKKDLDILLEREVPRSKEERRVWSKGEDGQRWKTMKRDLDDDLAAFLRKEISKRGVGAKQRLRRSEVMRHRHNSHESDDEEETVELGNLLAALSTNSGTANRTVVERVIKEMSRSKQPERNHHDSSSSASSHVM